jgi:hypothetical protein
MQFSFPDLKALLGTMTLGKATEPCMFSFDGFHCHTDNICRVFSFGVPGARRASTSIPLVTLEDKHWNEAPDIPPQVLDDGVFTVPSFRDKAEMCASMNVPIDVGVPVANSQGDPIGGDPLIDLSPLLSGQRKGDADNVLWQATGNVAQYRSAAATACIRELSSGGFIENCNSLLKLSWWGSLLPKGLLTILVRSIAAIG